MELDESITDWKDKYFTLLENYNKIERENEDILQENFSLKRELLAEKESNKYLSDELDTIETKYSTILSEIKSSLNEKIENLKYENNLLKEANINLELKVSKTKEIKKQSPVKIEEHNDEELNSQNITLNEFLELELKVTKERASDIESELKKVLEETKKIMSEKEYLDEQLSWYKESFNLKKVELEEKIQQLEDLQDQNAQLSFELNSLKIDSVNHGQKGNSLFAEVDDQRQKIRHLLVDQNQKYQKMTTAYQEILADNLRLKRDIPEIMKELESCKALFKKADLIHNEALNQQIIFLEKENENLGSKLKLMENILAKDAVNKNIDMMLSFRKSEIETLKKNLYDCLKKKCDVDQALMFFQKECARYKFEASELRILLKQQENLSIEKSKENINLNESGIELLTSLHDQCTMNKEFLLQDHQVIESKNSSEKNLMPFKEVLREPNMSTTPAQYRDINLKSKSSKREDEGIKNVVLKSERVTKGGNMVKKFIFPPRELKKSQSSSVTQ